MLTTLHTIACIGIVIFFSVLPVSAVEYKNTSAMNDISMAKVYFDVNIGIPMKLVTRLMAINSTYDQLTKAGIHPEFIVGFRGKASFFVTKADDYVLDEDLAAKKQVQDWIKRFKSRGIRMEQCNFAAKLKNIDPQDFLPEIEVIQNGYVSMIVYQTKGYSQIPMD